MFDIPTNEASEYNKSRRTAHSQDVLHCNNQPTKKYPLTGESFSIGGVHLRAN